MAAAAGPPPGPVPSPRCRNGSPASTPSRPARDRPRVPAGRRESEEPDAGGCGRRRARATRALAGDAGGSLIVFVVVGSLTIARPVVYYLLGGAPAKSRLDETKDWLALHHDAVMAVLFLVFGANLLAEGVPPLT